MTFLRLAFSLLIVGISIAAMAADKPANTSSGSGLSNPTDITYLSKPFVQDRANSDLLRPEEMPPRRFLLSDLNGDVCYTMRSYKVKRTERLRDDQTGRRGYSTCEKASNYRVHSTESKAKESTDRH